MAYALKKRGSTWYVRFTNRDGTRVYQSTKESRKDLAEREAERIYLRSRSDSPQDTTLAAAAEGMLNALRLRGRSEETIAFYLKKLRHLARAFDKLSGVTAVRVDDYVSMRTNEGASQHSIAKELIALRLVLKHARRRGEYGRDPATVLPTVTSNYAPKQRFLTEDEAERLWRAIANPGAKRYVAFVFATTARHSEVMRATGLDVSINGIRIHGTKTAKSARVVPIVPMLSHWADRAFEGIEDDHEKVAARCGSIRHVLRYACQKIGLEPVSPNDLRRSVAHWLRGQGIRLEHVSAFMGHSTTRMVETVYGRMGAAELAPNLFTTGGRRMDPMDSVDSTKPREIVPRDGIEPPTRGFSSRGDCAEFEPFPDSKAADAHVLSHLDRRIAELKAHHEEELEVLSLFREARACVERHDQSGAYQALYQLGSILRDRGRR